MAVDRKFWEDYAPYYTKLALSPVYKQFVADTLKVISIRKGERILDLGSGPGHFAQSLSREGGRVSAVDYSQTMIEEAKKNPSQGLHDDGCVEFIYSDVYPYLKSAANDSFDLVLASLLVSYLEKPDFAIAEMFRVLRPGGRLIMSNPVPNPPFSAVFWKSGWTAFRYLFYAVQLLRYARKIKRFEQEGVFHFFTAQETQDLLIRAGFERNSISMTTSLANTVYLTSATKA